MPSPTPSITPKTSTTPTTPATPSIPPTPTILDQSELDKRVKRSPSPNELILEFKDLTLEMVSDLIENRRHLLTHPVVESFLSAIWQKSTIRKIYIGTFYIYLLFLIVYATFIGILATQPKGNFLKFLM